MKIEEGTLFLVKRELEGEKSLNVGLVKNMVIFHLNFLNELRSLEETFSLEDLETIWMKMMKMNMRKRLRVKMN